MPSILPPQSHPGIPQTGLRASLIPPSQSLWPEWLRPGSGHQGSLRCSGLPREEGGEPELRCKQSFGLGGFKRLRNGVEVHCGPWHQFIQGRCDISSGRLRWLGCHFRNYSDLSPGSLPNLKDPSGKKVSTYSVSLNNYESPRVWYWMRTWILKRHRSGFQSRKHHISAGYP